MDSKKYINWVKTLPCSHCQAPADDAHHIIGIGMGIMGRSANDLHTMPLCRGCHTDLHRDPKGWPQIKWVIRTQLAAMEAGKLQI